MRSTKVQLVTTISAIIKKYKKKYCVASQAKLIELLETFYGVKIKRRMLGYHLADLRKMGLIKSIRRTHRNSDGTLCLETSATCITCLGYHELWKMGCEWAKKMHDKLKKKYHPRETRRTRIPASVSQEEVDRRREMGRAMFKTEAYRKAFSLTP